MTNHYSAAASPLVSQESSASAKISLFRSLFRGREDMYARRFESRRTGKSGYAPACSNEWISGVCEKPKIKCANCRQRRFLPVTDQTIRQHLAGNDQQGHPFVMGVYPLLLDETCWFLAADFDKSGWQDDIAAYSDTCRRLGLSVAIERSRSGQGAHAWLFFGEPVSANLARRLGCHILTETMDQHPDLGLDSYDRFFPNQDTLPQGGFGNLIALPLQKEARLRSNSVFVDSQLAPHVDQWQFLAQVRRIGRDKSENLVKLAERRGRIMGACIANVDDGELPPWSHPRAGRIDKTDLTGMLPDQLEIVIANDLFIKKQALPPALLNRVIRLAAFQNPEFYKAQAMRLSTFDKPRIIGCAENHPQHISLPRGCLDDLRQLLRELSIQPVILDQRCVEVPLDLRFLGQLRNDQTVAAQALLAHETGVLSATTAFGKTVIAAWLIAQRKVNTLVLVHRRQLLDQWIERLGEFLSIATQDIGQIGGGRRNVSGRLDVATMQSLIRRGIVNDVVAKYGHLIVDECHHLSAPSFEQVARRAKAKYVTGLSATLHRKDGHHPIVLMQCGPVRHHVDGRQEAAKRPFDHTVLVRPTAFETSRDIPVGASLEFHELCQQLITNERRNQIICDDVVAATRDGRSPIVLTERKEHVSLLAKQISNSVDEVVVLRGGMSRRESADITSRLADIPVDAPRVLVATGKYIGEGFDDARLDTLFLTFPVSWRGTIAQYAGRLHRLNENKQEVRIYDYADLNVAMLSRMFDRRCRGYKAIGYEVLVPASAVPGWPTDVMLPTELGWKQDYAASVHRLARDGVDQPLARLFLKASRSIDSSVEGEARARSATEAFLFRRLETLAETVGQFRLNHPLPISFDGWGQMEVDLFCGNARLAVELDGQQHLGDADAYRRDRRKDVLLQEHGYTVLRFLCEDVGHRLESVLDTILRAMAHGTSHRK